MQRSLVVETHTFDASREPLGRLATKVAVLLMGKHRPSFQRHQKQPVRVVVTRSDAVMLTGRKEQQKMYRRHSGYVGHLKEFTADWMREHDSRVMIREAVSGMLPKNRLRKQLMKQLEIHKGDAK
ncbi:MAG: 50S ribosomal protein L13 [Candidatus Sungbacteria bacterium RIFCSPLOWO2_01_FULL_60_25]|uniref:Large ribosomal subunit protein uL13 n=1 Tax=Candidatus Sungbacteria bacterium RIFCSPLOWO2_01_FULL_60_25 TaxID=1802281 RepID=A0A1G2LAW1_9BACT|nr:MAG: 50S ribosomal protein L13 [Candidatus Sungbacteria bacterium RIFCSPLOWO2_01_FULL_60_25]